MTRQQLEHIIRAAAANADVRDIVVIGSQAILGAYPDAPAELTSSLDADVFPKDAPQRSILIDGAMGELSLFHETLGITRTAWTTRPPSSPTAGASVWCESSRQTRWGRSAG